MLKIAHGAFIRDNSRIIFQTKRKNASHMYRDFTRIHGLQMCYEFKLQDYLMIARWGALPAALNHGCITDSISTLFHLIHGFILNMKNCFVSKKVTLVIKILLKMYQEKCPY